MIKIHLGCWNEAPVKSHKETSLADAVNDHCVVHLKLYLSSHNVKKSDAIDDEDDVNDHCVVHLDSDLHLHDVDEDEGEGDGDADDVDLDFHFHDLVMIMMMMRRVLTSVYFTYIKI